MNHSNILPFYMTYPLPMYYDRQDDVKKDLEYLQQMYPAQAKRYQRLIARRLDRLDYRGSMIYDEYPDKWQLYRLNQDILKELKEEEAKTGQESSPEKWEWTTDMVQVLLFYEIYKRRHSNERGILHF